MADSAITITQGTGTTIDTRTESTNSNHRQVIVAGDPSDNNAVAGVVSADPGASSTAYGAIVRLAGSATVQIAGSSGSLSVHILSTGGTIQVKTDPSSILSGITSSIAVYFDRGNPTVTANAGSGTFNVAFSPAKPIVLSDIQSTSSIFTVSGSTSGVSVSGVTLVAPSASYNFKVFAYSIQTTGIVSLTTRFTNGAGSATEFWRPVITPAATSSAPVGANLAVTPPGYLFATGTNTTLALLLDSATLVHYSVSYIKESA